MSAACTLCSTVLACMQAREISEHPWMAPMQITYSLARAENAPASGWSLRVRSLYNRVGRRQCRRVAIHLQVIILPSYSAGCGPAYQPRTDTTPLWTGEGGLTAGRGYRSVSPSPPASDSFAARLRCLLGRPMW